MGFFIGRVRMHIIVIDGESIDASGSFTSKGVSIPSEHNGFSLYWAVSGNGECKFEYLASPDGKHYVLDDSDAIASAQTKTSGPGSDGIDMVNFAPWPCDAIAIKCTETGTSASVTVTAILCTT
jgi:hypothetical protein